MSDHKCLSVSDKKNLIVRAVIKTMLLMLLFVFSILGTIKAKAGPVLIDQEVGQLQSNTFQDGISGA